MDSSYVDNKRPDLGTAGESNPRQRTRWIPPEAMIVAGATALCSLIAFAFEIGYSTVFFKVPIELIVIDAQRIMVAALMIFLGATPILIYLFFAYSFYIDGRPLIQLIGAVMGIASPFMIFLPFLAVSQLQWYIAMAFGGIGLFIGLVRSLYLTLRHRRPLADGLSLASREMVGFLTRVPESDRQREPSFSDSILVCGVIFAVLLGWVLAVGSRLPMWFDHSVLSDRQNYVFVRRYGDNFVFKEVSTSTGEILDGIEIRTLQGDKPIMMQKAKMRLRGWWQSATTREEPSDKSADALTPENYK